MEDSKNTDQNSQQQTGNEEGFSIKKQNEGKSYIEKIVSLEDVVDTLYTGLKEAETAFNLYSSVVQEVVQSTRAIQEQLSAILQLSEDGEKLTQDNMINKIKKTRADNLRNAVEEVKKEGSIETVNSVESKDNIISYSTKDVEFNYQTVSAFGEDLQEKLVSKKAGDEVDGLKIIEVFKASENTNPNKDSNNVEESQREEAKQ